MARTPNYQWLLPLILALVSLAVSAFASYSTTDKETAQRLTKLETKDQSAEDRLKRIELKVDRLEDKVDQLLLRMPH